MRHIKGTIIVKLIVHYWMQWFISVTHKFIHQLYFTRESRLLVQWKNDRIALYICQIISDWSCIWYSFISISLDDYIVRSEICFDYNIGNYLNNQINLNRVFLISYFEVNARITEQNGVGELCRDLLITLSCGERIHKKRNCVANVSLAGYLQPVSIPGGGLVLILKPTWSVNVPTHVTEPNYAGSSAGTVMAIGMGIKICTWKCPGLLHFINHFHWTDSIWIIRRNFVKSLNFTW